MNGNPQAAPVALEHIHFQYGETMAIRDVTLAVEPGELVVLVGPSGCGKSTLLRLVAGLLRPTRGAVRIDGYDVVARAPEQRQVGWVPQSYALFDHLSVAENIAFGPRMRGADRAEQRRRTQELLELCRITELADRSVRALSGGQRQRVAIARALAVQPRVLLLDEPLAALDPQLRHELRARLVELIRASGVTTLFVTHDQAEALGVADRIAVMDAGRIAQFGTPQELWERPQTAFVARFLSAATIVTAQHLNDTQVQVAPGLVVNLPNLHAAAPGGEVHLALRPAELRWGGSGSTATAAQVIYAGGAYQIMAQTPDGTVLPCIAEEPVHIGAIGSIGFRPEARITVVQP